MATIYFTSNADSGTGTLRAALSNAVDGDTIEPDETYFAAVDPIVISLSSQLAINKSVTLRRGGNKRIRISGQKEVRHATVSGASTVEFQNVDFVCGRNTSTCGGVCAISSNNTGTFRRCMFAGCECSGTIGVVSTSSSSYTWVQCAAYDCIFTGNSAGTISRCDSTYVIGCTCAGNTTNETHLNRTNTLRETSSARPSTLGFVKSPPDNITKETFDPDAWLEWDLRLTPYSANLTGGTYEDGDVDIYGNARKENGALGAIEGSWLIADADAETVIDEDLVADHVVINAGADIQLDGVKLRALDVAINGSAAISAPAGEWGFFIVPEGTDSDDVEFVRCDAVEYTADIQSGAVTSDGVEWEAEAPEIPIVIQTRTANGWETIAHGVNGAYVGEIEPSSKIRLYDGKTFFVIDAPEPPPDRSFWTIKSWAQQVAGGATDPNEKAWSVKAWTNTPIVD